MFPRSNVGPPARSLALQSRAQTPSNSQATKSSTPRIACASGYRDIQHGRRRLGIRTAALGLLLLCYAVFFVGRDAAAEEKELFACKFPNTSLAKPWKTIGGTWQVQQGVLKQGMRALMTPAKQS